MGYILHIPGWYPNRHDPFTGDFVQRHVHSIAMYERSVVLFLIKDPTVTKTFVDVRKAADGNLIEYIVYYAARGPLERGLSLLRYLSLGVKMVRRIIAEHGEPSLMHVHVIWKAGALALRCRRKFGWKYLVTEHWTGYTPDNPEGLHTKGPWIKRLYKNVYRHTTLFLPVSQDLAAQVQSLYPGTPCKVVYNVADTTLFHPPAATPVSRPKKLLHVSTMNYQKNIGGILHVLERLCAVRPDVQIMLVGPYTPEIKQTLIRKNLLDKQVLLTGELPYTEVATQMATSDGLFLFSRFENLPCVILEAHCCGLPVIATRVGGVPEVVNDSNGILVTPGDEDGLLLAMTALLDNERPFDRTHIAKEAEQRFSYSVIGRQLSEIYRNAGVSNRPA